MAAPCGCGGSAVVVEGVAPICVERSDVRPVRYTVSLCSESGNPCEAINNCVAENLGPGLIQDEGTGRFQVALSGDTGNTLTFGTDQGLMNPGGTVPPAPAECRQTIDDLPAAPDVLGAKSLAGLHHAFSSPYGVEYCLANQMDIIHFQVATNADDVGVVSDSWDDLIPTGRSSIFISQDIRQLNTSAVQSTFNYAGDVDDPVTFDPGPGAEHLTAAEHEGGWYGWLEQRYYQPLAQDFLRKIDAKAIAMLACVPRPGAVGSEAVHITGAIRAIAQLCAQDWSMIGVSEITNATTVINNDMTPILNPDGPAPPDLWGETTMPYPVVDVTDAGIEWIMLSDHYDDSVFTAYQSAGINVLMMGNSRQEQYTRITTLGIRGYMALDPVYFQDFRRPLGTGDKYSYRAASDPWQHRRPSVGQLTHMTDQQAVRSSTGLVRGRVESGAGNQGLILPEGFGLDLDRASVLIWECPVLDPLDYTIQWRARWNTLAADAGDAKMGCLFGADTDANTLSWTVDATKNPRGYPEGQQTLYRAFIRQNGQLGLAKWETQASSITQLANTATPAIVAGEYSLYTLRVVGDQITLTREDDSGQEYSVTTADTQYRGPYFFMEKSETFAGSGNPTNEFEGQFRDVRYAVGAI